MRFMRSMKRCSVLAVMLGLVLLARCTGNSLDDGDGADVALLVVGLQTSPVTGDVQAGTCSVAGNPCLSANDCPTNEFCNIELGGEGCQVSDWGLQLRNVPLSANATTSPFNDIVVTSIAVDYTDVAFNPLWSRVIPLTCTVAANGTQNCRFSPIAFDDLVIDNTTLNLAAVVRGSTPAGEPVRATFGAQLNIEACLTP